MARKYKVVGDGHYGVLLHGGGMEYDLIDAQSEAIEEVQPPSIAA